MTETIRLGIVGTGGMANHHAEQFASMPSVTLTSCYDVARDRAEAFARKHDFPNVAADVDDLIGRVDAVVVATPDRFHGPISLQALAARKHLLCEKPLTVTLDEARQVADAALDAGWDGVIHMVNFSYRASSAFQRARELVASGALGQIRHVHSSYLQSWLASSHWGAWNSDAFLWRLSTAAGSGGVLGDLGCHILDLTTGASEDLRAVRCTLRTFPKVAPDGGTVIEWQGTALDANDTALIEMELTGGGVGVCHTSRWATGHANSLAVEVHGTEGALRFDLDRDYHALDTCLGDARHRNEWTTETLSPTPTNYERFVRAIQTGRPDQPDVLRGAQIQSGLDACLRSAASGQWETILPWTSGPAEGAGSRPAGVENTSVREH